MLRALCHIIMPLLIILCLICSTTSQTLCSDCMNITSSTTSNFTCNYIGCSGFMIPSATQYLFNQTSVMCSNPNGSNGGSNCFYPIVTNSNFVTFMFCNSTMLGCASCANGNFCKTCYNGFYLYQESSNGPLINCQLCANAIPGCFYCSGQATCTQCFPGFVLFGSVCYNLNGTMPRGMNPFTYEKGGSTVAEIITAVLIFSILAIILIAVCILFCKDKKQIPDFLNPALQQSSIEESIIYRE